nr:response regulator [Cohnella sp. CFH 77786]
MVDDEPLALLELQKAIKNEVSGMEVIAAYSNPEDVVAGVLAHRPDVVFLDIQMPEIDGLNLGKQIQSVVPGIEIVFVTGYDRYAVRAFELNALDYIMKPIDRDRFRQTVLRLKEKLSLKGAANVRETNSPFIRCFHQVQFQLPGMDAQTVKWRTSKAQELFAYLLHHRDRTISRGVLLELLWPDLEESKAAQQLYTTIYYIRQTLKKYGMDMISIQSGDWEAGYRLELGKVRVEAEKWENDLKQLGPLDPNTADAYEHVLNAYNGHYLEAYGYIWAEHERERFRLLWLHQMRNLGEFYERHGLPRKAIEVHLRIQRMLPDEEESYFSLMKLYDAAGESIGVEEQYLLLTTRLERDLETPVNTDIDNWYRSWKLVGQAT